MKLGFTINGRFTPLPRWMGIAVRYGLQAPVSRVIRGATLGAQVAALDHENRILLIRQSYTPDWQFPGGGVDAGETVEEAAIREMYEEAGARPESPLELLGVYANFRSMPGDHVFLYTCRKVIVDEFPTPNREIVDHGFFALDALPENTAPAVHRRLAEMDGQVERSLHW